MNGTSVDRNMQLARTAHSGHSSNFVGMILYFTRRSQLQVSVHRIFFSVYYVCMNPNSAKPACRTRSLVTLAPPVSIPIPSTGLIPLAGGRRLKRDRPHVGAGHRTDPNCTHTYVARRTLQATQLGGSLRENRMDHKSTYIICSS